MSINRTIFRLALAACLFPSAAPRAADLIPYTPEPAYEEPAAFGWSGAYVGAHGGLSSRRLDPFAGGSGLTAGVQAGYNLQLGPGILGAEIEGSYLGGAEHRVGGGTLDAEWRAAAKAKAGLTFDRTLVYGTAGYALTKFDGGRGVSRGGGWEGGYLVGGGVEQGFAGGLSAKVEYNYVMTPDVKTITGAGTSRTDLNSHVLKAGVNFRF